MDREWEEEERDIQELLRTRLLLPTTSLSMEASLSAAAAAVEAVDEVDDVVDVDVVGVDNDDDDVVALELGGALACSAFTSTAVSASVTSRGV